MQSQIFTFSSDVRIICRMDCMIAECLKETQMDFEEDYLGDDGVRAQSMYAVLPGKC